MRNFIVPTLFFICIYPTFGQKDVSVKTIDQIKQSIVPVVCGYVDEENTFRVAQVAGTGFFVDEKGRFITDAHVLNDWDQIAKNRHPCFPAIYIPNDGWTLANARQKVDIQWFTFSACQTDPTLDLAVCQPTENPFTSKRISRKNLASCGFDTAIYPEGTAMAFTGFPLEFSTPVTSKGFIAGYMGVGTDVGEFDYVIDKGAWPGASGSPVYLSNGKVIAIMRQRGQNDASGIAISRSAAIIEEFLSKHPYTEQKPQEGQPTTQN